MISFLLMATILISSNHKGLSAYTHYLAACLVAAFIAVEFPLSGTSANPARTFGPTVICGCWHALWIYFAGPLLGMLAAAELFLFARKGRVPYCAKLHHHNDKRCIFRHDGPAPDRARPFTDRSRRRPSAASSR